MTVLLSFFSIWKSHEPHCLFLPSVPNQLSWLTTLTPHSSSNLEPGHFPAKEVVISSPISVALATSRPPSQAPLSPCSRWGIWFSIFWYKLKTFFEILGWWRRKASTNCHWSTQLPPLWYIKLSLAFQSTLPAAWASGVPLLSISTDKLWPWFLKVPYVLNTKDLLFQPHVCPDRSSVQKQSEGWIQGVTMHYFLKVTEQVDIDKGETFRTNRVSPWPTTWLRSCCWNRS